MLSDAGIRAIPSTNIMIHKLEMKGDRDGKSAKSKLPSAVVVNNHMYPHHHLHHFYGVFLGKNDVGMGIHNYDHSLQLH